MSDNRQRIALIIDDGHGQNTAGKSSPTFKELTTVGDKTIQPGGRFRENTFNMAVADYLEAMAKQNNVYAEQIAPEHEDIALAERARRQHILYNKFQAFGLLPLTISIHANAHEINGAVIWNSAHGMETFYKPHIFNQPAPWSELSEAYAHLIQKHGLQIAQQRNRKVEPANFYVLRTFKGITVLAEAGFMTNKQELRLLASRHYQKNFARAILNASVEMQGGRIIPNFEKFDKKI